MNVLTSAKVVVVVVPQAAWSDSPKGYLRYKLASYPTVPWDSGRTEAPIGGYTVANPTNKGPAVMCPGGLGVIVP